MKNRTANFDVSMCVFVAFYSCTRQWNNLITQLLSPSKLSKTLTLTNKIFNSKIRTGQWTSVVGRAPILTHTHTLAVFGDDW